MTVGDTVTLPPALMAPTALLTDPDNPENDARNCVLLPLLIVMSSVVKEVIAAGPGTVVVVVVLVEVVVVGATVVEVVVVEVVVIGAFGAAVVVGAIDEEDVVSGGVWFVGAAVVVLVEVPLEVGVVVVGRVVLVEVVIPDSIGDVATRGEFMVDLIPTDSKIDDFVKPFGHFAVDLQSICLVVDLVQIARTPFGALFDALVVLDKHLPVRENCNALLVVMQTVLAVLVVHEIFDSDLPHAPVLETLKIT